MIISHKHKFIFIKGQKTAGTSIEIGLSEICGKDDVITPISKVDEEKRKNLGFLTAQNYHIPEEQWTAMDRINHENGKEIMFYNHISCKEVKKYVSEEIWNSYFKFTVERNPFDKIVSFFYWRNSFSNNEYKTISEFILKGKLDNLISYDLYSINHLVAVDKIYQYEKLDFFEKDLSEKLNLKTPFRLPVYKAKSKVRKIKSYRDVLDDKAVELIKLIFAREIQLLGYQY